MDTTEYRATENGKQTKMYICYRAMLKRCYNENDSLYHRYGARGITACERWLGRDGFSLFTQDMGECPRGFTLDRIDVDKSYEPSNCRWADRTTQARNTSRNRKLTINDVTKCMEEWALESGISSHTIAKRLRRGWSAADAVWQGQSGKGVRRKKRRDNAAVPQVGVSKPHVRLSVDEIVCGKRGNFITPNPPNHVPQLQGPYLQIGTRERLMFVDGVCKPIGDWLKETIVEKTVVADRLKRGWTDKDALFTPTLGVGRKRPGIRRPQATPSDAHPVPA